MAPFLDLHLAFKRWVVGWGLGNEDHVTVMYEWLCLPGRPDKEDKKLMPAVRDQCIELKSQPLQQKWGGYSCVTFSSYFLFPSLLVFVPDLLPVWRSGAKTPHLLTPPPSLGVSCFFVSSFLPHPPISPSFLYLFSPTNTLQSCLQTPPSHAEKGLVNFKCLLVVPSQQCFGFE